MCVVVLREGAKQKVEKAKIYSLFDFLNFELLILCYFWHSVRGSQQSRKVEKSKSWQVNSTSRKVDFFWLVDFLSFEMSILRYFSHSAWGISAKPKSRNFEFWDVDSALFFNILRGGFQQSQKVEKSKSWHMNLKSRKFENFWLFDFLSFELFSSRNVLCRAFWSFNLCLGFFNQFVHCYWYQLLLHGVWRPLPTTHAL